MSLQITNLSGIIEATVPTDWKPVLLQIIDEKPPKGKRDIQEFLTEMWNIYGDDVAIYPPVHQIFSAFTRFNIQETKVLLLGQDPYIRENQAMGLSFSVPPDQSKIPPSLINIYKEIESDLGISNKGRNGDLTMWAKQGVLLLNSALTVLEGKSNSHQKEWFPYTDKIIKYVSDYCDGVVFILWGNFAKSKKKLIDLEKHDVVEGVHPSPLSANNGFFGCKHFSKCNQLLIDKGKNPIQW